MNSEGARPKFAPEAYTDIIRINTEDLGGAPFNAALCKKCGFFLGGAMGRFLGSPTKGHPEGREEPTGFC